MSVYRERPQQQHPVGAALGHHWRQAMMAGVGVVAAASIAGCAAVSEMADVAAETGAISEGEAESIQKTSGAIEKTFEDITPRQEYYIGRAVAAQILRQYEVYDDDAANRYINRLGQALAATSSYPRPYDGYHFVILDSDEVNAFAAPSGFILVSRGLLELCDNEDAVAGVLGHEIVHVGEKHGLKAIKQSRLGNALSVLAEESAKQLTDEQLAEVTEAFAGSVADVTNTLVENGYSRGLERDADQGTVDLLKTVDYRGSGYVNMLEALAARKEAADAKSGFFRTHPDPTDRLRDVEEALGDYQGRAPNTQRRERFERFVARLEG